jgi:hypothetical protein
MGFFPKSSVAGWVPRLLLIASVNVSIVIRKPVSELSH